MTNYAKVSKEDLLLVYPYHRDNLVQDNPHSVYDDRFSLIEWFNQTDDHLVLNNKLVEVVVAIIPDIDFNVKAVELNDIPSLVEGIWTLTWITRDRTAEELAPAQPTAPVTNV